MIFSPLIRPRILAIEDDLVLGAYAQSGGVWQRKNWSGFSHHSPVLMAHVPATVDLARI